MNKIDCLLKGRSSLSENFYTEKVTKCNYGQCNYTHIMIIFQRPQLLIMKKITSLCYRLILRVSFNFIALR
jgi:hypothetical protein